MTKEDKPFSWSIILVCVTGLVCLLVGLLHLRLEITSKGSGWLAAQTEHILYAPHDARVEQLHVEPNDRVEAGTPLLTLTAPGLEREWLRLQDALAEVEFTRVSAMINLREIAITGGIPEAMQAEETLEVHRKIEEAYEAVRAIYRDAAQLGGVTRIQEMDKVIDSLRAQLARVEGQRLLALRNSELPQISEDRERSRLQHAEKRKALLEAQIALHQRERDALIVRAPADGLVTDVYSRHPGQLVAAGEALLTLVQPEDGYEVKAILGDRNVDLIEVGMLVRLESKVYQANREGYMMGSVRRIVKDTRSASAEGFEVTVAVDKYPIQPVIGSRIDLEVLITDGNPLRAFFNNPQRQPAP